MKKLLAVLAIFASLAFSQAVTTAPMDGTVTDPQGGVVVGAKVLVTNVNNGQTFNANSDDRGHWMLPAMQGGLYKVTVTMAGFRTLSITEVKMDAGTAATVSARLEVGQVTETIDVAAGAELVQTTNATVNTTLQGRQVFELPAISRGGLDLLVSQPGVQSGTTNRSSTINGLPQGAINVTLDGLSTQDQNLKSSNGFFTFIPITQDSIEEVTLTTSAAGADSTGEGAAQIKFVTKSGTNEYHGGGFWQVRNTFFNANSYFNNINGLPRNIIKMNQGGVRLGGPIARNKLFFFTNFEKRWLPQSAAFTRTVLQKSAIDGVYTYGTSGQYNVNVLNLAKSLGYNTTLDPIISKTLNQINSYVPNGRISPISGNFYENTLNYQVGGSDKRQYSTSRVDYNVTNKHQISLTYSYNVYNSVPDVLNSIVPVYPGTGVIVGSDSLSSGQTSNRFAGTLALRSALTTRLTNELRGGLDGGTTVFGSGLATPAAYAQWRGFVPSFGLGLSGVNSYGGGSRRNSPVKQLNDTVSLQQGSHMLSFGANFTQVNLWSQSFGNAILPTITFGIDGQALDPVHNGVAGSDAFTYSGAGATMPNATSAEANNAAALYALLTGRVSAMGTSVNQDEKTHTYAHAPHVDRNQQREFGFFGQDTWRIFPSLTFTAGLRFEAQGALTDLTGNYTNVDIASIWGISGVGNMFKPNTLTGIHPTYTPLGQSYKPPKMWSPSVGFAWQMPKLPGVLGFLFGDHQGATVLRGGYAINTIRYGTFIMQAMYGSNPGNSLDASIDPDNYPQNFGTAGSVLFSQPNLPSFRSTPNAPSYPFSPAPTDSLNAFDPNLKLSYVQSWNIGLQRQIGKNNVVEVRYTGNHGVKEWRQVQLNEVNVFENGFLAEFNAAYQNLLIARGQNINATSATVSSTLLNNFGNSGLPGQVNLPIMQTALATACCNNATYATYIRRNQPYAMAAQIYTNATRMSNLTKAGYPANFFVVNPDVPSGGTYIVTNMGSSYYDALQVELRRRMSAGLTFQGSYVFGKSLINGPASDDYIYGAPVTFRNLGLTKGPIGSDIRHAFKVNFIYELPFGPGKQFASSGGAFLGKVLEGWEITGIARTQSGTPSQISASRQNMNQGGTGGYSDVVLQNMTTKELQDSMSIYKTTIANTGSTTQPYIGAVYFLPPALIANSNAAFEGNGKNWLNLDNSAPYVGPQLAPGRFGYRVFLYGPWQNHLDMSVIKRTRITEKTNVEFRAQVLNVLNLTNFYSGTVSPSSASFGRTTSAYSDISNAQDPGSRVIEFVLRLNF